MTQNPLNSLCWFQSYKSRSHSHVYSDLKLFKNWIIDPVYSLWSGHPCKTAWECCFIPHNLHDLDWISICIPTHNRIVIKLPMIQLIKFSIQFSSPPLSLELASLICTSTTFLSNWTQSSRVLSGLSIKPQCHRFFADFLYRSSLVYSLPVEMEKENMKTFCKTWALSFYHQKFYK